MKLTPQDTVRRALVDLSLGCYQRPLLTLGVAALLCAWSVALAWVGLDLRMDWTYLFQDDDPVVHRVERHRATFPYPGDIAVLVDQGTAKQRQAYVEELVSKLQKEPALFHSIYYKLDLATVGRKALYYLEVDELKHLAVELERYNDGSDTHLGPSGQRILKQLLRELETSLSNRGRYQHTPLWEMLDESHDPRTQDYLRKLINGQTEVYFTLGDGRIHAVALKSGGRGEVLAGQAETVARLRAILADLSPSAYGLRVRLTGLPVMLNDERKTCTRDSVRSGIVSLLLIAGLFIWGFGEPRRPVMAVAALSCGLGWTLGYTTLAVGHLNFITVSMVTMLMGLGIDFGIHICFRYSEELRAGCEPDVALARTMGGTGMDTLVGALATAAAFVALTFTGFRGIADLGVIAAGGVLLCYLSTVTVLPALFRLGGEGRTLAGEASPLPDFEKHLLLHPRRVVGAGIAICLLGLVWGSQVHFDYNLLKVQAQELESVRTEIEIVRELKSGVLSATSLAPNLEEARRRQKAFEALPTVARVTSVVALIPPDVERKKPLVKRILGEVDKLSVPAKMPVNGVDELLALQRRVEGLRSQYTLGSQGGLDGRVARLEAQVKNMDPGPIEDGLGAFQDALHEDLTRLVAFLKMQQAEPPSFDDLPEPLRVRFVSTDGQVQLSVVPNENIWERDALQRFLADVTTVDPDLIGHPVVQDHILQAMGRAHRLTIWFTLAGVLLVMGFYLRGLEELLLTLLPTAVGVICIVGAMGYCHINFNVVNFVALPISVGIGVVYGVHSLRRMEELGHESILTSSTGPAIMLSGLTTMVGFASLMTAQHRGLNSLGFVISVGVAANFIVSLVFLPALARLLRMRLRVRRLQSRQRKGADGGRP
ncbi:MAG: MMPL family transporter [Vulcanimicrobiota bacterium]